MQLRYSESHTSAGVESIVKNDVARTGYYLTKDLADRLKESLLSIPGEAMEDEAEDIFVGCRKRLTLSMELAGGFDWKMVLYESGYLRFIADDVYHNPETSLLFHIGREKAEALIQLVETRARAYVPDLQATVTATTAHVPE